MMMAYQEGQVEWGSQQSYYDRDSKYRPPGDDLKFILLDGGADTRLEMELYEMTPLMCALEYKRGYEVVHRLISFESDINARTFDNKTALTYAVFNKYNSLVVGEILSKGAKVDDDIFCYAVLYNNPEIVKLLIDAGGGFLLNNPSVNVMLEKLCYNCPIGCCSYRQTIDVLVDRGFDLEQKDDDGNTFIHKFSCYHFISLVIKCGVSVDTENNLGYSPLSLAVYNNEYKKARTLLLLGANPNCLNFLKGETIYENLINLLVYYETNLSVQFVKTFLHSYDSLIFEDYYYYLYCKHSSLALLKNFLLFFNKIGLNFKQFCSLFQLQDEERRNMSRFFSECILELKMMCEIFMTDSLTFYQFCMMKNVKRSNIVDISSIKIKYNCKMIKEFFPMYEGIIILRIKDNQEVKLRRVLRKGLEKIVIQPLLDSETDYSVALSYDCSYHLSNYLSNRQLYELFHLSLDSDAPSLQE